jgi:amino acid adenylation domain-containing protein
MALSLLDLLEASVARHPGRAAVSLSGGRRLAYAELERDSARIACALRSRDVGRGARVALLMPKSLEAVAAVWGVLRAGAAYVPIDPMAPPQRAAWIAKDCRVAAVLASSDLAPAAVAIREAQPATALLQVHGGRPLDGAERPADGQVCRDSPRSNVKDLAYVLYTSGSTGVPKGVMVSHGAALSFVEWAATRFRVGPEDVLSNHAPLHFDLSVFDVFGAAYAGAQVVVLDEETVRFPMASADALERERISIWYSVPGALRRMVRHGRLAERRLDALRMVLFAGEVYPGEELRALQRAVPHPHYYNLYGPTETNVCTYWRVPPRDSWAHAVPPIGKDCENCEGVVAGPDGAPVPDGTPGELLVRGGTIMEGYWGDPERTRTVLLSDFRYPHLADRFHRTGDIVTRQPDGDYLLHGRADHMVKIRGYRVELGEVEAALHGVPGVAEAAVVSIDSDGADGPSTALVAFVVPDRRLPEGTHGDLYLRRELARSLPRYMVPSELVRVDSLPTTTSGKLDRQALAAAARVRAVG